ncbi:MAG: FecR domain-containing protein [Planctomycetaceae bacterium]|nr:FecR domain-containing protein [Planctomycetaceae bacterium]
MNDSSFEDLMDAIESGERAAEQAQKLSELICTDATFRARYVQYMSMCGQLAVSARRISESVPESEPTSSSTEVVSTPSRRNRRVWMSFTAIAASVALAVFGFQYFTHDRNDSLDGTEGPQLVTSIAVLEEQDGYWHSHGLNAEVGESIHAGRWLRLDQGTATVRFKSGVTMKLIGDTLLQIVSAERVLLVHGDARTNVPENATGFTIATTAGEVVDLGTEFSVSTDGSSIDVHVHDGLARIDSTEMASQMVSEGQAYRVDPVSQTIQRLRSQPAAPDESEPPLHIAYQVRAGTLGNQPYAGKVGHDFVVHRPIEITRLGVFDSASDGLKSTLTCELWRRDTRGTPTEFGDDSGGALLATVLFEPGQEAALVGAHRMQHLKEGEMMLEPGSYSVVAFGFGTPDPNGNDWEAGWYRADKRRDDGEQSIEFVGTSRFGAAASEFDANGFPLLIDTVFADRYLAGTFEFRIAR